MRIHWSMRFRYASLLMILLTGTLAALIITNDDNILHVDDDTIQKIIESHIPYPVRTIGCSIPGLQAFDERIKKLLRPPNVKPCVNANITLLSKNDTHIWINKRNYRYYNIPQKTTLNCCYKSFQAVALYNIKYEKRCTYFSKVIKVNTDDEFVRVSCKYNRKMIYDQFYLFAIRKKSRKTPKIKSSSHSQDYSVIVLGIDAVSRMNFHRTMPKTLAFLREKGAVELMGYNIVSKNTSSNVIPVLFGINESDFRNLCSPNRRRTSNSCPSIWKRFVKAGFSTALGEDSYALSTFIDNNYLPDISIDYYLYPFMYWTEKLVANNKDFSSYLCMGDIFYYRVLLDYIESLTYILKSSKLFGFFWEVSMSHDYLNYPMVMDGSYESLFNNLHTSHYLDNTILIVLSSHGLQWGDIRGTKQGRLEERLPFAYFLMPPSFREKYDFAFRNLRINSRRLVTAFDIHATLTDLANLRAITDKQITFRMKKDYAWDKNISLFLPIPSDRTCEMAGIERHWCTCHSETVHPMYSTKIEEAAAYLVRHLNMLIFGHVECARLSLSSVQNVTELTVGIPDTNEDGWRDYTVLILTAPGGAIFKATMRIPVDGMAKARWSIVGAIGRINRNPAQSSCMQDNRLKPYCVCNPYRFYKSFYNAS